MADKDRSDEEGIVPPDWDISERLIMDYRFLIVGCGSIGERHLRVFQQVTPWEIVACDPRTNRLEYLQRTYGIRETYTDYDQVDLSRFPAVAICTPTHMHIPMATRAVEAGCHVLLEKPISTSLAGVDTLLDLVDKRRTVLQVGYVMRSHPGLRRVYDWVQEGAIGDLLAARVKVGYYVPDYRPDYQHTYWAKAETGGGCILDASHQLDYIQWLMGIPELVSCFASHLGSWAVEETVEDAAVILLRWPSGAVADLHFNHVQRNYIHELELVGREGTLIWSYQDNRVGLYCVHTREWEWHDFELERDDIYREQARSFVAALQGTAPPRVSGVEGKRALQLALAALQSARTNAVVRYLAD
ncbi:MAG: Gfo/Idh/MocA family protein [Candidatus Zipacnadales bacterium]